MRTDHAFRRGVVALAKAAVLVVGVPFALWRLWFIAPLPHRVASLAALHSASTWSHLVVLVVAIFWLWAASDLVRQIAVALGRHEPLGTSWSARWAISIAALVFLSTAPSLVQGPRSATRTGQPTPPTQPLRRQTNSRPDGFVNIAIGECLADVSERLLGCPDDWPLIAGMNFGRLQTDGTRMLDPVQLRTGWRLALPKSERREKSGNPFPQGRLTEFTLLGLGVISTCALARRLRQLRRAGDATRRPGERRRTRATASAEAALLPFADAPIIDWIDAANRLLWRTFRDNSREAPDLRLVRAGPDGVELLFADPHLEAPWPFLVVSAGRWWRIDPTCELAEISSAAADCDRYAPALVPVGDDGSASYLLPIGRGRHLAVAGEAEDVDAALHAIVAALRSVPWSDELAVELIGLDPPPAEEQCYSLNSSTPGALALLASETPARPSASTRWRREPLIVVARQALDERDEKTLQAAGAVAGVIAAGERGTEVLAVSKDDAVLHPYGVTLTGMTPNRGQRALIEALFADARRAPEIVPIGGRSDEGLDEAPTAGPVEVRVLRPNPDIVGLARAPSASQSDRVVELLAYLALHGGRRSIEEVGEALFSRSSTSRLERAENLASATRAALGVSGGDRPRLRRAGDDLVLDDSVTCDWLRARRLLTARTDDPQHAVELLEAGLALFDGAPLSGVLAGYTWWRTGDFDEEMTAEVVDAAHRLASLALAAGEPARARLAIERGRLVDPDSEILARDEMAVCDAEGDRPGVRAAYAALEATLERLSGNEPSIETRSLFEALDSET